MRNCVLLIVLVIGLLAPVQTKGQARDRGMIGEENQLTKRSLILRDSTGMDYSLIGEMKSVRYVFIAPDSQIDIPALFAQLAKLPKLKSLGIADNHLEELPTAIAQMNGLKFLDLGANPVRPFADKIVGLTKLRRITFSQYPDVGYRSWTDEDKVKLLTALKKGKIVLVDHFGSSHGVYRLGEKEVEVTLQTLYNP